MNIECDKCKQSAMIQDRVYRMSGCLVAIGYFLVIPGLLLMLGGISVSFLGIAGTPRAATTTMDEIRKETVARMKKESAPAQILAEYEKTGRVSSGSIDALPMAEKRIVQNIIISDSAKKSGAVIGTVGATVCGGAFTLATFLVGLPAFIIGFLLILKRNVWRCPMCGYVFDRA